MKPQVRTVVARIDGMYHEYKEPLYAAPPLLLQQRMVDAGWLGRKSGSGFYSHLTGRSGDRTAAHHVHGACRSWMLSASSAGCVGQRVVCQ
jgi:3-hydroxyacyl-CoA dehydrogenase